MRQAYAHEAVLALPPGADERAPGAEREVRHRIDLALAGQWPLPGDLTAAWRLTGSGPSDVTPAEEDHAGRLIRS